MKAVAYGLLSIILLVVILFSILAFRPRNIIAASLKEGGIDRFIVHASTDNELHGWFISLLWKKDTDKWFVYYLNHEAYFLILNCRLEKRGAFVDVFDNDRKIGVLDTEHEKFSHLGQNFIYDKPVLVIHDVNIDDRRKWVDWTEDKR